MDEGLIDYAMPLMIIERRAKEIHALCLAHKYDQARDKAEELVVEARLLQTTLKHMGEQEK